MDYNLAIEYAILPIILILLASFARDYESKQPVNRFLKVIYLVALASTLSTIISIEFDQPTTSHLVYYTNYVAHFTYFALLPSLTTAYLSLCIVISSVESNYDAFKKSLLISTTPYIMYLAMLISNFSNGEVYTITYEQGYIRGPLYQLPYYLAGVNIILIIATIFKNRNVIHKDTRLVVWLNMAIGSILLVIQALNAEIIMTGLWNTASVMAVHLYTQAQKKSIDQLTSVQNSLALRYNLEKMLEKHDDFSIYIISMRGFKSINERDGLEFGDQVLRLIAKKILQIFPYQNVYRYGGDEFAVVLKKAELNENRIHTLLDNLREKINIQNIDTVALDLVCARVDNGIFGSTSKELISSADFSISILKQTHGEPRYLYDPTVVQEIISNTKMIQQIKEAIDGRKFQICYQPMYCVKDHAFTQAEALVRMVDDTGGLISPASFIDIAEVTGLVVPMTFVILDIVCEDYRRILNLHGEDTLLHSISVNFPYHIFLSQNVEENVLSILEKYNIDPSRIKIEITERTFISEEKLTSQVMENMRKKGFVFELDDFGVDYSNMSTFLNLPMQIIKIDRSVLLSAMDSSDNMLFFQHLVRGIIATGRTIIIEGVEDQDQLDFVIKNGCEYIQGYVFSKPLKFNEFAEFIEPKPQRELLSNHNFDCRNEILL